MTVQIESGKSKRGWSFYASKRKCDRLFFLENRLGLDAWAGKAAGLGSLLHDLMAAHYLRRSGQAVPDEIEMAQTAEAKGLSPDDAELGIRLVQDYAAYNAADPWVPVAVEQEYRMAVVPLGGGLFDVTRPDPARFPQKGESIKIGHHLLYTARVDLAFSDHTGGVWFADHKSTWKIGKGTSARYALSGQFHGQQHLGKLHYGDRFRGIVLNMIQTRRGRKFERLTIAPAPRMVEDFPKLIMQTASEIADADVQYGMVERNWPTASHEQVCMSTYGLCAFYKRCMRGAA